MSVKVNLLPGEIAEGARTARTRNMAIGAAALVAVAMAGVSMLQLGAVTDAEAELLAAQDANRLLQVRIQELSPFSELETRQSNAAAVASAAMGREASVAGILQDLSAVIPPTAEIEQLAITFDEATREPAAGGDRLVEGRITVTGRVLVGLAPGVERLIRDVERAAVFENVFVTSMMLDADSGASQAVGFAMDADLGPEILTHRYRTTPGAPR